MVFCENGMGNCGTFENWLGEKLYFMREFCPTKIEMKAAYLCN